MTTRTPTIPNQLDRRNGLISDQIYWSTVEAGVALRDARVGAGLSQAELAERVGTSQATISAYENGTKQPSVATLSRLLAATGSRLTVTRAAQPVLEPSSGQLKRTARGLADVLALAEALPVRHRRHLRYPRLAA
jgi:transcriptional regulator with XRE-family HTH domain